MTMTAREFVNLIEPFHGRTSCSDVDRCNGFGTGDDWKGRCTRCMYLEIIESGRVPEGFDNFNCAGA